ncbi:hypothetical protein V1477_015810 [Vespula maculifrons]|uniref:Uncharacterized protein n=1 Tax=Vespula maculifrons TaxID=7453 RepID=A0ABD2BB82_VESMC
MPGPSCEKCKELIENYNCDTSCTSNEGEFRWINARTANAAIIVNAVIQVPERNVVAVARQPAIAFARPVNVNYDLT